METGRTGLKHRDIYDPLTLYEVADEQIPDVAYLEQLTSASAWTSGQMSMTTGETAPGGNKTGPLPFDTSKAHQAGIYDYLLGGCFR